MNIVIVLMYTTEEFQLNKLVGDCRDHRLLSLFRFKIWWMIPRMGNSGSDVPTETQMLLLEAREDNAVADGSTFYIVLLPVLDGLFRSSLQGNSSDELEFCIESGSHLTDLSYFL